MRHGQPLRSDNLNKELRSAERAARRALADADALADRIDQLNLALLTVDSRLPEDLPQTPSSPARMYLPARPLMGTELAGTAVVTQRTKSRSAVLSDAVQGYGELSLLRPGEIWAALSDSQTDTFEARLDPAYLTEYNELVLPYVSGGALTYRLHHSRGYYEYRDVTETSVFRYQAPREFNGMIEIVSSSHAALEGQYIHTAAGVSVRKSDWVPSGTLEASRELNVTGTIRIENIDTYPGKIPADSYRVFHNGEDKTDLAQFSVQRGDMLRFEIDIDWMRAVNYVSLDFYHITT